LLVFEADRPSDSPYVERVWRCHSEDGGSFLSIAECRSELVVARHRGRLPGHRGGSQQGGVVGTAVILGWTWITVTCARAVALNRAL
jgi:hypothetical protein